MYACPKVKSSKRDEVLECVLRNTAFLDMTWKIRIKGKINEVGAGVTHVGSIFWNVREFPIRAWGSSRQLAHRLA